MVNLDNLVVLAVDKVVLEHPMRVLLETLELAQRELVEVVLEKTLDLDNKEVLMV